MILYNYIGALSRRKYKRESPAESALYSKFIYYYNSSILAYTLRALKKNIFFLTIMQHTLRKVEVAADHTEPKIIWQIDRTLDLTLY